MNKMMFVSGLANFAMLIREPIVKVQAFEMAKSLVNGKGIINLGAGTGSWFLWSALSAQKIAESPQVALNVDIMPDGMPNFMELDLENPLPFGDKQFDVAFMSHVLEHLENWKVALDEAMRVADYVVVVLPYPFSLGNLLSPDHKQHFSFSDIKQMRQLPNVMVYY